METYIAGMLVMQSPKQRPTRKAFSLINALGCRIQDARGLCQGGHSKLIA